MTETAGRLRAIRTMLARMEGGDGAMPGGLRAIELKFARAEDVLPILRQMLEIPDDKNVSADGSIRIAQEAGGGRLFISGQPEKVARAADDHQGARRADARQGRRQSDRRDAADRGLPGSERRRASGDVGVADASGRPTRRASDGRSKVEQSGRPGPPRSASDDPRHAGAVAARGAAGGRDSTDASRPRTVLASINKLFPSGDASKGTAPLVDADPSSRQLMIRGTEVADFADSQHVGEDGRIVAGRG